MNKNRINSGKKSKPEPTAERSPHQKTPLPFPARPTPPTPDECLLWSEGEDRYVITWTVKKVHRIPAPVVPIKSHK